jgi:hypothetical protein
VTSIFFEFSINADRALLKSKIENINLEYVKYQLEPILRDLAKGRIGENRKDEFTKVYPYLFFFLYSLYFFFEAKYGI